MLLGLGAVKILIWISALKETTTIVGLPIPIRSALVELATMSPPVEHLQYLWHYQWLFELVRLF